MERIGFKMKLNKGCADEYKRRHAAIWKELIALLKDTGIKEYSIFLDEESNILFGYLLVSDKKLLDDLPNKKIMQKWWAYMKDIMETNADNSPVNIPLREVFYLK